MAMTTSSSISVKARRDRRMGPTLLSEKKTSQGPGRLARTQRSVEREIEGIAARFDLAGQRGLLVVPDRDAFLARAKNGFPHRIRRHHLVVGGEDPDLVRPGDEALVARDAAAPFLDHGPGLGPLTPPRARRP